MGVKSELAYYVSVREVCSWHINMRQLLMLLCTYSDASVTGLDGITTPAILNRNFQCTGDEARLRDCVISNVNISICGNKRVGLVCDERGKLSSKYMLVHYF